MLGTLGQISQGIVTGLGVIAVGAGLVYAAAMNGLDVQLQLGPSTFEISAPLAPEEQMEAEAVGSQPPGLADGPALQPADPPAERTLPVLAVPSRSKDGYYDQVAADLSLQVVSLNRLAILLREPDSSSYAWRNEVVRLSGLLGDSYRRLSWVRPPKDAVAMHSFVLEATARCLSIADSLGGDLSQLDASTMTLIGGTLGGCTGDLTGALQALN